MPNSIQSNTNDTALHMLLKLAITPATKKDYDKQTVITHFVQVGCDTVGEVPRAGRDVNFQLARDGF